MSNSIILQSRFVVRPMRTPRLTCAKGLASVGGDRRWPLVPAADWMTTSADEAAGFSAQKRAVPATAVNCPRTVVTSECRAETAHAAVRLVDDRRGLDTAMVETASVAVCLAAIERTHDDELLNWRFNHFRDTHTVAEFKC
jgi:hypothetical protein